MARLVVDELGPSGWTAHSQPRWEGGVRWDGKRSFYAPSSSIIHAEDAQEVLRLKFDISPDFSGHRLERAAQVHASIDFRFRLEMPMWSGKCSNLVTACSRSR